MFDFAELDDDVPLATLPVLKRDTFDVIKDDDPFFDDLDDYLGDFFADEDDLDDFFEDDKLGHFKLTYTMNNRFPTVIVTEVPIPEANARRALRGLNSPSFTEHRLYRAKSDGTYVELDVTEDLKFIEQKDCGVCGYKLHTHDYNEKYKEFECNRNLHKVIEFHSYSDELAQLYIKKLAKQKR